MQNATKRLVIGLAAAVVLAGIVLVAGGAFRSTPDKTREGTAPAVTGRSSQAPLEDGAPCSGCQASKDEVTVTDPDGYVLKTGSAEAGRIQLERRSGEGHKEVTFDAGEGFVGRTGASNIESPAQGGR